MVLLVADQAFATVSVHKCFVLGENNTCLLKIKVNLQSWTKVLGTVMQYSYFFCHSGSLVKQCILFEIFLQFSLPYPIQRKNSGLWGEGKGRWACVNWKTPRNAKVSQDFCP